MYFNKMNKHSFFQGSREIKIKKPLSALRAEEQGRSKSWTQNIWIVSTRMALSL